MSLASSCFFGFANLRSALRSSHNLNMLRLRIQWSHGVGCNCASLRFRSLSSQVEVRSQKTFSNRHPCGIKLELLDGTIQKGSNPDVNIVRVKNPKTYQQCERQSIPDLRSLAKLTTIIVFDIETTGFSRNTDRIIEFAARDLHGGNNSTFQTLVNPERDVPNSEIHGISTRMVSRPDVPRWKDLIPILMAFVQSRQMPGGPVMLVAHNGRRFDVPFLIKECGRCSVEIPEDWFFVDTLPLARQLMKQDGSKLSSSTLQALRQYYEIPLAGKAHRAMSDVDTLAYILQKLTIDLKLPVWSLLEKSFKASDY